MLETYLSKLTISFLIELRWTHKCRRILHWFKYYIILNFVIDDIFVFPTEF